MSKAELKRILGTEVIVQDFFVEHLNNFTDMNWYAPLHFTADKKGNWNMVSCQVNGSIDQGLEPASVTHTGHCEHSLFNVELTLHVETTFRLMDQTPEVSGSNLHEDRIFETRYAMLHGLIASSSNADMEIIGYMNIGPTTLAINEDDNYYSTLTYTFDVGIQNAAWPTGSITP